MLPTPEISRVNTAYCESFIACRSRRASSRNSSNTQYYRVAFPLFRTRWARAKRVSQRLTCFAETNELTNQVQPLAFSASRKCHAFLHRYVINFSLQPHSHAIYCTNCCTIYPLYPPKCVFFFHRHTPIAPRRSVFIAPRSRKRPPTAPARHGRSGRQSAKRLRRSRLLSSLHEIVFKIQCLEHTCCKDCNGLPT